MMPKFTIEDHEKRMRELLQPKPQVGGDLLTQFRDIAKKRKTGAVPRVEPPPISQEI